MIIRSLRFLGRAISRTALLLILFSSALHVGFTYTDAGQNALRKFVAHHFEKKTGRTLELGHVEGFLPFLIEFHDVNVQDADLDNTLFTAETLTFWWSPVSLMWSQLTFPYVEATGVKLSDALLPAGAPDIGNFALSGKTSISLIAGAYHVDLTLTDGVNWEEKTRVTLSRGIGAIRHERVHITIEEPQKGMLSRILHLPQHPAIHVDAEYFYDKNTAQARTDIKFDVTDSDSLSTLPPEFQSLLGGLLRGSSTLLIEEDETVTLHSLKVHGDHIQVDGNLSLTPDLKIKQAILTAEVDDFKYLEGRPGVKMPLLQGAARAKVEAWKEAESGVLWDVTVSSEALDVNETRLEFLQLHLHSPAELVEGSISLTGRMHGAPIDFSADYLIDKEATLQLDDLALSVPEGTLTGEIKAFPSNGHVVGHLQGDFLDLSVFSPLIHHHIQGEGQGSLTFSILPASEQSPHPVQQIAISVETRAFQLDQLLQADHGTFSATLVDPWGQLSGQMLIDARDVDYSHWELGTLFLDLEIGKEELPFYLSATGRSQGPFTLETRGSVTLTEASQQLKIETLEGTILKKPLLLEQPVKLTLLEGKIQEITPFHLTYEQGTIRSNFTATDEVIDLQVELEQLPLALLRTLYEDLPLSGIASGKVHLQGPPEKVEGEANLAVIEAHFNQKTNKRQVAPFSGSAHAKLKEGILLLKMMSDDSKQPVDLSLSLPLDLCWAPMSIHCDSQQPVNGRIVGKGSIAPFLQFFMADAARTGGEVDIDLTVDGSLSSLNVKGEANIVNGSYESLYTGTAFRQIAAQFEAKGSEIVMKNLSATDGKKGKIEGGGFISVSPHDNYPFIMNLNLANTTLLRLDRSTARASGEVTLRGDQNGALLTGDLNLDKADIEIPDKLPPSIAKLDIEYTNAPQFKPASSLAVAKDEEGHFPIALNVLFTVPPGKANLKGRGLNAELKGEVAVRGTTEDPQLHGELNVVDGEFLFAGKQFQVISGHATVDGPPETTTLLRIVAEYQLPEANVWVTLQGPTRQLELEIKSAPTMPLKEIISQVLFNKPSEEINKWQAIQVAQAVLTVTGGSTAPDILGKIQRGIGLDRMEFTSSDDELNELSFQIGKYLTKGFFVGLTKSVDSDKNRIAIEADLTKSIKVRGEIDDDSEGKMWLQWKMDY